MRLRSFAISNHARVQDADIEVREHLVLVGPNDVGKSSVLRCLDLVLRATTAQLYGRITTADLRNPDEPLVVSVMFADLDDDDRAWFPDETSIDPTTQAASLEVRREARIEDGETLDIRRFMPGGGDRRQVSRDQLARLGWRLVGAVSSVRDLRDDRNATLDDILRSIDLGAERAELDGITQQFRDKLQGSPKLGDLRGLLAGQLSRALPDTVEQDDLSFVPGAAATDDVFSDVRLQVRRHGTVRNLSEQSDGTRAMFAVALYDLVTESANIVAIDEPELHLHPGSQRSVASLLRAGSNQKILATHSSDIVGAFPPETVVTVKSGGVLVQPQNNFLTGEGKNLIHWWIRDRLEPLTASHIVTVEGASDRVILEKAAELTGRDLDRLGVSIIEGDGSNNVKPIVKLFGPTGFDVPLSILIDLDAVTSTAAGLGVADADLVSHSVWISDKDLEAEYVAALGSAGVWDALQRSALFSPNELRNCPVTGPAAVPADADLAEFCGHRRRKVKAAVAVAAALTEHTARQIKSVEGLLADLEANL